MKNIIDYEIKFINNKPIIYIKYDDNSFDVLKLTIETYREVIDKMEVNVSGMTREKILYTERKKLTKSGLISLGIVFSSPYAFALTNGSIGSLVIVTFLGATYYFISMSKYNNEYDKYLKYSLYQNNEPLKYIENIDLNGLSLNSLILLKKRIKLIEKLSMSEEKINIPLIDISVIKKISLKDLEKIKRKEKEELNLRKKLNN